MDAVFLEGCSFSYAGAEAPALVDLNLSLGEGTCLALLGADGSGRSTLLALLAGLMVRFYPGRLVGACRVFGRSCGTQRPEGVGFLLEDPCTQYSGVAFSVFEEVALAVEAGEREETAWHVLTLLGVAHLSERNPFTLSGGEAKRVALATLLAQNPRLLLLDEPFSQLDPEARHEVRQVLQRIKAQGTTLIVSGSDVTEVAGLAEGAAVLENGHLVYNGTLADLLEEPAPEGWGICLPLVTRVARSARTRGLYKGTLPLILEESEGWCL